jgi:putative sugar O-methyltransferase
MKMENLFIKTSISDEENFRSVCEEASKNKFLFNSFKTNQKFTEILEHTSYEQGLSYIEEIEKDIKIDFNLIEKFKENDLYGNPITYDYKSPYNNISPSTIRYIKILNDLIKIFGDLTNFSIVEIGIGYGGQSKIIQDHFQLKEYNYVDLPEVMNLTKTYMDNFNYKNLNFLDFKNLPNKKYDLVISNYAITECSKEIQDLYIEKIINNSEHCFIIGNDIGSYFNLNNYNKTDWMSKLPKSKVMDETPKTHENNYVLYF